MNLSMKKLCLFVTLFLSIFVPFAFASEPVSPVVESTPSPKLVIELSLSELPKVYLTPASPFYFLKTLWENVRWLAKRSPEGKALLALELAERRLSEALRVSEGKNLSLVERLFKEREVLLGQAWSELGRGTRDRQLALGGEALLKIKENLTDEEAQRADNLSAWRDAWVAKLEEDLGPPRADLSEATEAATKRVTPIYQGLPPEATPEAKGGGGASIWELLSDIFFGPRRTLLSPLAAPEED